MAGGKGERFWPRSRTNTPKQLRKVYSNKTLLRETIDRALTLTSLDRIFIGTNAVLKKAILEQEKSFPEKNFIIEPEGKNTAPIIALASLHFQKLFNDPVQVVLSADAFIEPAKEFTKTVKIAIGEASNNLVLLGIKPNRPEIGYGYIATGKAQGSALEVKEFVEKPDIKTAGKYIKKPNFYWNPGIFVWKTSMILDEFRKYCPEIIGPLERGFPFKNLGGLGEAFRLIPSLPVDIAIMEKSKSIAMVPASFQWDDVGSWLSLERILPSSKEGNQHQGKETVYYNSKGIVSSVRKDLVAFLGVENLVVVEEEDVLFVSSKDGLNDIKSMLAQMKKNRSLQKYLE
ncbi:mannose-1-phosphate guanylyltransferase [Leptospira sp. GIMC2001]|uniref:mannose-1-phosphate guanylyltransferase n=1 Tax=Leptospira sp. GIMC2001 TaxID=1513297 RepID=UPI002349B7CF|nr:mannose-1-phosphate guanylyltransferase [Leptospira sp. GIMC2001]WCL51403.1 mannose-1-phosphate guanylyltransferase [Leptospira sp. GIMC2001]